MAGRGGETASGGQGTGRYWRDGLGRFFFFVFRSVTFVGILGIYDFDVGEGEETPPSVHLSLPLAADVHPRDLYDVANLRADKTK